MRRRRARISVPGAPPVFTPFFPARPAAGMLPSNARPGSLGLKIFCSPLPWTSALSLVPISARDAEGGAWGALEAALHHHHATNDPWHRDTLMRYLEVCFKALRCLILPGLLTA